MECVREPMASAPPMKYFSFMGVEIQNSNQCTSRASQCLVPSLGPDGVFTWLFRFFSIGDEEAQLFHSASGLCATA